MSSGYKVRSGVGVRNMHMLWHMHMRACARHQLRAYASGARARIRRANVLPSRSGLCATDVCGMRRAGARDSGAMRCCATRAPRLALACISIAARSVWAWCRRSAAQFRQRCPVRCARDVADQYVSSNLCDDCDDARVRPVDDDLRRMRARARTGHASAHVRCKAMVICRYDVTMMMMMVRDGQ